MQIAYNCVVIIGMAGLVIQNIMQRMRIEALEFIVYDLGNTETPGSEG